MADLNDCPFICGKQGESNKQSSLESTQNRFKTSDFAQPYVPGCIEPPVKKVYPPNAPPKYLPQPTDSTSGDILTMGPVGPWAPGHMDWSPQAGITGVRPVVDRYSITHYSTGEWRKNNKAILSSPIGNDAPKVMDAALKQTLKEVFKQIDDKTANSDKQLDERIKILEFWNKKVKQTVTAIKDETELLEEYRTKLKSASRIFMLPEAVSKECIDLRSNRYEPDMVRDEAEQELIKEVAIVGEIRKIFHETLVKIEVQMENNRAAKAIIEGDWTDKMTSLQLDIQNRAMQDNSSMLLYHPGVARWPENASTLEYWEHYCAESVRNCEEVRQSSEKLREGLMTNVVNGAQDLKKQCDRTNMALAETIDATQQMCDALERNLRDNLKATVEIENTIETVKDNMRKLNKKNKLVMTRLHARNYNRPNVENCRDNAQYALMDEAKFIKETDDLCTIKLREAEAMREALMKYRGDLEKDIASKRKALNVDENRLARVRAHIPSPEEFANA